ncbi:MAG TPA: NIPSNAP family protein, partial [Solibacterales bacterium]|nr:NIPSNAP family protein [Bryobacterales bacterium]
MTRSSFLLSAAAAAALPGAAAAQSNRVFELRTYYTLPGRLPNLL